MREFFDYAFNVHVRRVCSLQGTTKMTFYVHVGYETTQLYVRVRSPQGMNKNYILCPCRLWDNTIVHDRDMVSICCQAIVAIMKIGSTMLTSVIKLPLLLMLLPIYLSDVTQGCVVCQNLSDFSYTMSHVAKSCNDTFFWCYYITEHTI